MSHDYEVIFHKPELQVGNYRHSGFAHSAVSFLATIAYQLEPGTSKVFYNQRWTASDLKVDTVLS